MYTHVGTPLLHVSDVVTGARVAQVPSAINASHTVCDLYSVHSTMDVWTSSISECLFAVKHQCCGSRLTCSSYSNTYSSSVSEKLLVERPWHLRNRTCRVDLTGGSSRPARPRLGHVAWEELPDLSLTVSDSLLARGTKLTSKAWTCLVSINQISRHACIVLIRA